MPRSRLNFTIDQPNLIIVVRYHGLVDGADLVKGLMANFNGIVDPWTYDFIFDLRRHEGTVTSDDNAELGRQWKALAKGRDAGRQSAIVSTDPLLKARLKTSQSAFPDRTLAIFDTVDEGLEWIHCSRETAAKGVA